jgi:thiol-disulfide isomerase/thioredoxin
VTRGPAPADHPRPRCAPFTILSLAAILGACLLLNGAARADSTRFIPWNDATTPALALNDLAGRPHTLADYRGSVVLVNFWATWCEPCREEMTSMRALHQRLAGRPFAILLVNFGETRMRVSEFVKRESLAFSILLDPNQDASRAWRVRVLPSSFLVAPDSRVRYGVIGEIDWASAGAVDVVQALLR